MQTWNVPRPSLVMCTPTFHLITTLHVKLSKPVHNWNRDRHARHTFDYTCMWLLINMREDMIDWHIRTCSRVFDYDVDFVLIILLHRPVVSLHIIAWFAIAKLCSTRALPLSLSLSPQLCDCRVNSEDVVRTLRSPGKPRDTGNRTRQINHYGEKCSAYSAAIFVPLGCSWRGFMGDESTLEK